MRITSQACCADYMDHLGKVQGATQQTGDLFSCCCCSALVSHQQSPSSRQRTASATQVSQSHPQAAGWGGPPPAQYVHQMRTTSFRRNAVRYNPVLQRATAGQHLSQEPLLDNAAMPRKAKCNTANHCLNNQQQNSSV